MTTTRERALEAALRDIIHSPATRLANARHAQAVAALALPPSPESQPAPVAAGEHTPGPWRAVDVGDGYEIWSSSPHMSATVATLAARRSVTGCADARLIAAAPDMLAALQYLESCAPAQTGDGSAPIEPDECVEIVITGQGLIDLRAAIARATGREG